MPTFGELLTSHIDRSGIGDSDLARRVGVSRLTLIRWKEGVTAKPRYREDVLRCAELLRLTPEERDELLLAGEFEPETPSPPTLSPGPPAAPQAASASTSTPVWRRRSVLIGVVSVAIAAVVILAVTWESLIPPADPDAPVVEEGESLNSSAGPDAPVVEEGESLNSSAGPDAPVVEEGESLNSSAGPDAPVAEEGKSLKSSAGPDYPVAEEGESLIVVAPFANYTAGQQGFNVRGRLKASIDQEVAAAGLSGIRTAEWPEELSGRQAASSAAERSGAAIVIWGEYDSGRVLANLTSTGTESESFGPQVVDIASSPSELPTAINIDLTEEVRSVALLTLSQLYLEQDEYDLAKAVLIQALEQPPSDPAALANLRYRLGHAYLGGEYADLDEAIWRFTQVLSVQPRSADTYNSRGLAYLERGRPGDEDLAIADLTRASELAPHLSTPYFNRAVAYMERRQPGDLDRALRDLDWAIEAGSDGAGVFVNRSAVYLERGYDGDLELALDDLERAIGIDPNLATAWVNRGNALLQRGDDGDEEQAIADYTRAIELSPDSALGYYNRALVYSAAEDWALSNADLQAAQERDPRNPVINNTLCWQLGVQRQPEAALPYCDLALRNDPAGPARDSRGLVHSVAGRTDEAIEDFRVFLDWVEASIKPTCRAYYHSSRQGWITTLRSGGNPFDNDTLRELRVRPASPGGAPC